MYLCYFVLNTVACLLGREPFAVIIHHSNDYTYIDRVHQVSQAGTLRVRDLSANEFPHFHAPVDTWMQMPCHPKFSLDKHRPAQREARGCCEWWKIHTPLLPRRHSESTEFKKMNQLQSKTQLSGHNTCILIDVNLDTLKPIRSHATLSVSCTNTHACTHTISIG